MNEDRLIAAFGRLDRALSRVEQGGARLAEGDMRPDPGLADRHARLRLATADAIAEIDRLMGER